MVLDRIALILVIIGALNWGLIGLFGLDLVAFFCGGQMAVISRIIYSRVWRACGASPCCSGRGSRKKQPPEPHTVRAKSRPPVRDAGRILIYGEGAADAVPSHLRIQIKQAPGSQAIRGLERFDKGGRYPPRYALRTWSLAMSSAPVPLREIRPVSST